MRIAIITGASSGMGREFAIQISERYKNIDELWVVARREDRLIELKNQLKNIKVRPVVCDLSKDEELDLINKMLKATKPSVRVLVNSAGYGIIGSFEEVGKDNAGMCQVNCLALTKLTQMVLPYMSKGKANIINLASSAAFLPQPAFATYAATKSYVLSLSRAMNRELKDRNITVTAVCPGPVATEFFDIAETYNSVKMYKRLLRAEAPKVVTKALKDSYHGKDISVYGISMNAFLLLTKVLPHSFIMNFIK